MESAIVGVGEVFRLVSIPRARVVHAEVVVLVLKGDAADTVAAISIDRKHNVRVSIHVKHNTPALFLDSVLVPAKERDGFLVYGFAVGGGFSGGGRLLLVESGLDDGAESDGPSSGNYGDVGLDGDGVLNYTGEGKVLG